MMVTDIVFGLEGETNLATRSRLRQRTISAFTVEHIARRLEAIKICRIL